MWSELKSDESVGKDAMPQRVIKTISIAEVWRQDRRSSGHDASCKDVIYKLMLCVE